MTATKIILDPKIMMGKPVIKGTRITVETLLRKLAQKVSTRDIIKEYPSLSEEDIKEALRYAASTVQFEEIYQVSKR